MKPEWSKISLFFLLLVAIIGTSLRAVFFVELPLAYNNLVHAHSHIAFQGWLYTLLLLLVTRSFLSETQIQKGKYPLQFKLTIFILTGILIAFSLQGYGLYSIVFSSLFQLLNYWFIFRFFKDVNSNKKLKSNPPLSLRFVKTGLWLGILSTLAPWGIGILSAKGLKGTEAYHSFIYFFLHFQYNGWFLFMAIGLFFKSIEMDKIVYNIKHALRFYYLFAIAVIPALTLSYLGMRFRAYIIIPAYFAAICQVIGLLFFFISLKSVLLKWFHDKNKWFQVFISLFLLSFFLKVILQFIAVFPMFKMYAFSNKNIILAYLHLSFIGVLSFLLLAILNKFKWLSINLFSKIGNTFLVLGFILTEFILLLGGIGLWYNSALIFIGSFAMAIGLFLLLFSPVGYKRSSQEP